MKIIKIILSSLSFILLLSVISCKKKTTVAVEPTPTPNNGNVRLHFHTNVDTNEVSTYNNNYIISGGRKISVSVAQLYVSGIQLIKTDGNTIDITGLNVLKLMEVEQYALGSVPPGDYKSIRFSVGLAASTNSLNPAIGDSTLNRANMFFGATAQPLCYVFMNFQGKIDTSNAANNTVAQMRPFTYRIGTNAHLKTITMPDKNFIVTSDQTQYIHIVIDYNKLFTGVNLNTNSNLTVNTVGDNALPLSNTITNNIPLMFRYEY